MAEFSDLSLKNIDADIDKIVGEANKYRESDPGKSREILEKSLEKYPENAVLLNNLLYVCGYANDPDKTIKIAGKLLEKTSQSSIKYNALRFLAYAYKAKGAWQSAENAIGQIPEIEFNKLTETAFLFDGERKFTAATKQKMISLENLLQMCGKIAECYADSGQPEKAVKEIDLALQFLSAVNNPYFDNYVKFFTKQKEKLTNKK